MIAILAGNHREYFDYVGSTETDEKMFYANTIPSLRGVHISRIVVTGTFWNRIDAGELYEMAKTRITEG